ncbi:hypothetical protein K2173_007226 [Erythroxylum novogranatense]|uniref:Uncharacterized protein n=1 Tax=Erythroxylum novogranatense TaxID=1862640 RepID=A0AAV8UBH2_9ROSI|nr:hypothetical protein K2173_007226 [Erythroxylum novogranatense]
MKAAQCISGMRLLFPLNSLDLLRENSISACKSSLLLSFASLQRLCRLIGSKSSTEEEKGDAFEVRYLVRSCGLSSEGARAISKKIKFKSTERPDSVLALLRNHGFTLSQISRMLRKRPSLILAHPEHTLLPKLEFLLSKGISKAHLARTLSGDPTLLYRSLEKHIKPCYNFLRSILLSDAKIVSAIHRRECSHYVIANIEFLRESGVGRPSISILLTSFPEVLTQSHEELSRVVKEVKEMGFDPSKVTFGLAMHALSGKSNKSIRERCFEVYRKWGWSKDDILAAFKKHPNCMLLSESKISQGMDFIVNKMGSSSKMILHNPIVLFLSLEKRIIPRFRVINVLQSKGLVKKHMSLTSIFVPNETKFQQRYIIRFAEQVPRLLSVYKGKLKPEEV